MTTSRLARIMAGAAAGTASALALTATSIAAPSPANARQQPVQLASDIYVERLGDTNRVLEPASRLRPGDRVVTIVTWKRAAGAGGFTVTNPLPRTVYYQESAAGDDEVSVDGGRSWGRLGSLRVAGHLATPEDVTHIRWRIVTPAPQGRIAYSAIVR